LRLDEDAESDAPFFPRVDRNGSKAYWIPRKQSTFGVRYGKNHLTRHVGLKRSSSDGSYGSWQRIETMRVCLNCGRDLEKNARFCDICGQAQRNIRQSAQETGLGIKPRLGMTGRNLALLAMAAIMLPVVWLLLTVVLQAK